MSAFRKTAWRWRGFRPSLARATKWARGVPEWIREAGAKTATGLAVGCIAALSLWWLSHLAFPEIGEFGKDLGLRVGERWERFKVSGRPFGQSEEEQYLFLDVDPERGAAVPRTPSSSSDPPTASSELACVALARAQPRKFAKTLNCRPSRPLNRYLLAELVKELIERGAKLIVLDVVLAREAGVVGSDENQALARVLKDRSEKARKIPILFVEPVEARLAGQGQDDMVRRDAPIIAESVPGIGVCSAIAVPAPGLPVRRYFKGLVVINGEPRYVPSLPFLAATILERMRHSDEFSGDACSTNADTDRAPRIFYALPPLEGHQDDLGFAESRAIWAHYRSVYNRCLAARFWDRQDSPNGSECGSREMYAGKVVVIGASNPSRRDRHYTPLGDMSGPEVVINATRSFLVYDVQDSLFKDLAEDLKVVFFCAWIWLIFYAIWCHPKLANATTRWSVGPLALLVVLALVCWFTISLAWHPNRRVPSVDIFIPVLAIGTEIYLHLIAGIINWIEAKMNKVFRVPHDRSPD